MKKQCEKQDLIFIDDDEVDDSVKKSVKNSTKKSEVKWIDPPIGSLEGNKETFYQNVQINSTQVN